MKMTWTRLEMNTKMIIYKKGDLLQADEELIAHGCNCKGGFDSGVAGCIAKKYPEAKGAYLALKNYVGLRLGQVQFVETDDGKIVANCMTQNNYLPRGACHADYSAIEECMRKVKAHARGYNLRIAIPKIGSKLAGGDWNIIEDILKEVFDNYDVTIYTLE